MRKGWEYKKLGEICSSDLGKTLNKSKDVGNMRPYLCAINILWDSIDLTTLKEACFKDDEIDRYTVKYGDLLVCEGGDTGRAAIWDRKEPILYQNALHRLRFKEGVDARFIMYNLWHKKQIGEIDHKYSKGVTILHLVKSALLSISILLPPKSTQLAIVSELDKINELIRLKKEQLKDFDNLAQSLFYEMFGDPMENEKGWEVKKLNEIVSDNCSISYGIVQPGDGVENGVPVVRPVDMTKTFVSRKGLKNTTKEISDSYKRTILKGNEILMCVRGTTGLISMATPELQGCNVTRGIAPIECGPTCDKWFVFYQILNPAIQHHIAEYTRGIALKQINMKDVRDIPLCLPPLSLQRLFAQRIEQIEREKSEVQKSIQDLETLLASRMQYWFE